MTIVLDVGAVIAAERNDPLLTAIVKAAQADRTTILLPATALTETITAFPELSERSARSAGVRLAGTSSPSIVDGNAVDIAVSVHPRSRRPIPATWRRCSHAPACRMRYAAP